MSMGLDCIKLTNFDGTEYNAWKRKTEFGMQLLKIHYTVVENMSIFESLEQEAAWDKDNLFCKSYLLNCLDDHLADVYGNKDTAKEIWDALQLQYKDEDALSKTHLIDKFLDMKFEDEKEVLPQVKELEKVIMKLKEKKIPLEDVFIAGAIINKLPPSWMSFSTDMRRRKKQVALEDLKRFIRIEDEVRTRNNLELISKQKASANLVSSKPKFEKKAFKKKNFERSQQETASSASPEKGF